MSLNSKKHRKKRKIRKDTIDNGAKRSRTSVPKVIEDFYSLMSPEDRKRLLKRCERFSKEICGTKKKEMDYISELENSLESLSKSIEKEEKELDSLLKDRNNLMKQSSILLKKINESKQRKSAYFDQWKDLKKKIEDLERQSNNDLSFKIKKDVFNLDPFDDTSSTTFTSCTSSSSSYDESSTSEDSSEYIGSKCVSNKDIFKIKKDNKEKDEVIKEKSLLIAPEGSIFVGEEEEEEENLFIDDEKDKYNIENITEEEEELPQSSKTPTSSKENLFDKSVIEEKKKKNTKEKTKAKKNKNKKKLKKDNGKKKRKKKYTKKGNNKDKKVFSHNPYTSFYIPTHSFRGSFCFHCGSHDENLMTTNDISHWNDYLNLQRNSIEWKTSRSKLSFPSGCTCICVTCKQRPEYCICEDMFIPKSCVEIKIKDYLPKSKGWKTYRATCDKYKKLGIMEESLYTLSLNIRNEKDANKAVDLHDAFIYFWKRYLEHINTIESLSYLVFYIFKYSMICSKDKKCVPKRCVYCNTSLVKGQIQRGLCTRHKPQISHAREDKWPWVEAGRKKFEEWKEKNLA